MQQVLDQLGLSDINDGTWFGATSTRDAAGSIIESINPTTNAVIASVRSTTMAEYRAGGRQSAGVIPGVASGTCPGTWRSGTPHRECAAQAQGCAW